MSFLEHGADMTDVPNLIEPIVNPPQADGGETTRDQGSAPPAANSSPTEGESRGTASPPSPPEPPKWMQDRLKKQSAQLGSAKAEIARLQAEYQRLMAQKATPQQMVKPDGTPVTQAELQEMAYNYARQMDAQRAQVAQIQEFNARCDAAAAEGKQRFGADFEKRVQALAGTVDWTKDAQGQWNDPQAVQSYNQFLAAALETGDAPKIIHALGADLNEAHRIMAMNPIKQAIALAKLVALEGEKEPSKAPKPIKPLGSKVAPTSIQPDEAESVELPMAEWVKRRNAQVAERRKG